MEIGLGRMMLKPVPRRVLPKPKRSLNPAAPLLGKLGHLETRLARTKADICAAQSIRYRVFYEELGAIAPPSMKVLRRDKDAFDKHCDHLLVIDRSVGKGKIVGTYRLLLEDHACSVGGFYSEGEFDLVPLIAANPGHRLMELGRSCILPDYRSKRVMELLWQGTWAYAVKNSVDILFGCASFPGTDPQAHGAALSWLAQNATLGEGDCPAATPDSLTLSNLNADIGNERRAVAALPPLLKGYLRLGAKIGSQAVIDRQFDTIDVFVVLKVADINPRYLAHYGADASRFTA